MKYQLERFENDNLNDDFSFSFSTNYYRKGGQQQQHNNDSDDNNNNNNNNKTL